MVRHSDRTGRPSVARPRGAPPPGQDDLPRVRGTDSEAAQVATPTDRPGDGRIDIDLDAAPTAALVVAAKRRGVPDAEGMDRGTLLANLRDAIQY